MAAAAPAVPVLNPPHLPNKGEAQELPTVVPASGRPTGLGQVGLPGKSCSTTSNSDGAAPPPGLSPVDCSVLDQPKCHQTIGLREDAAGFRMLCRSTEVGDDHRSPCSKESCSWHTCQSWAKPHLAQLPPTVSRSWKARKTLKSWTCSWSEFEPIWNTARNDVSERTRCLWTECRPAFLGAHLSCFLPIQTLITLRHHF